MSVADPIEAISGVKKTTTVGSTSPTKTHLAESEFLYNTNYVIAVMKLTQVCMQHQQELVSIRSKLAVFATKIQANLNVLNQTMTTFENNAAPSTGLLRWTDANWDGYNGFGPNGNQYLSCDGSQIINYRISALEALQEMLS